MRGASYKIKTIIPGQMDVVALYGCVAYPSLTLSVEKVSVNYICALLVILA